MFRNILISIYRTIFYSYEPNYNSKKKKLILFFHPFGNRISNYFIKTLVKLVITPLLPDYHFEEYYYNKHFNNSSFFFVNGIYEYFNTNNIQVHKQIKYDIEKLKCKKYEKVVLFGFSMGGIYITSFLEYLQNDKIIDKIITINSPLITNTFLDFEYIPKTRKDMCKKWMHIYDSDYKVNLPDENLPYVITKRRIDKKASWSSWYDHFRWIFDFNSYKFIANVINE